MNYIEIKDAALKYSMRKDTETLEMADTFLRIVESRINRSLDTSEMMYRAVLQVEDNQEYYGLPDGFMSLRDIQIQDIVSGGSKVTPVYVAPEVMNAIISSDSLPDGVAYTLIANQIQLYPTQDNKLLEVVYRKRVEELSDLTPTTWLSMQTPDAYIFGLLVEISSFSKDIAATELWNNRFTSTLAELQREDNLNRWSGPALRVQLG